MNKQYIDSFAAFQPENELEAEDQRAILWYIGRMGDTVLTREDPIAHITSSGFIMNPTLNKVLMVHHNIRGRWAWTGGHADGDGDLLAVAIREAQEETGVAAIAPLFSHIAAVDVLQMHSHMRKGRYVCAHLHLSAAYILVCDEDEPLRVKPDENTAVRWFSIEDIASPLFDADDVALYQRLIRRARAYRAAHPG